MKAASGLHPRPWATFKTLRGRLTLWYLGLLVPLMLVFSTFLYMSVAHNLSREIDRTLGDKSRRLASMLGRHGGLLAGSGPRDPLTLPGSSPAEAVYDQSGHLIAGTDVLSVLSPAGTIQNAPAGRLFFSTVRGADGDTWRVVATRVALPGRFGDVLIVARSERDMHAVLRRLGLLMATAIPLTLLLAIAGGLFLTGRALAPIDHIATTAERLSAEDLSRRLNLAKTSDEVGRLAATFDGMLDRLDRAFQRQRQFTADVSHELRTPLAMLISQADIALERRRTPAEYQRTLSSMRDETRRMAQLVDTMLTLARAEAGQISLVRERLDLRDLAAEVVATMEAFAADRGVRLWIPNGESAVVEADQTYLTQLLLNLVENGVKYTPPGGSVTVSVESGRGGAFLRVSDTGLGIAPEDLPHIFDRFYRADRARSRADGGAGLGLAIARWVVQAHGGDVQAASEIGRGTTFTVRLPPTSSETAAPSGVRRV